MEIQELLQLTVDKRASDLHLIVGVPPSVRVDGMIQAIPNHEVLTVEAAKNLVMAVMTPEQKDLFLANKELDFSFAYSEIGRFRVNAYHQKGGVSASLRLIPASILTIEQLKLPKQTHRVAELRQGLVLVTGPTGHGKSSTLAAIIEEINTTRAEHIVTIEDPIEFLYKPKKSFVSQRELHSDTHSWKVALRSVLRQDPDVVLVGELRDYETIAAAITVAETGHLVLATVHTNSAAQTVDRIIDVFPEHQQQQVRMQFANTMEVVLSQRLIPSLKGGRVPATEVLLATPAVRNTIREGKTHQIDNVIQTSAELGMMTLESSLAGWVKAGEVAMDMAQSFSLRPNELARLLQTSK